MGQSPSSERCKYTYPEDHNVEDSPNRQNCCWRKTVKGADRCIWHLELSEVDLTGETLRDARTSAEILYQSSLTNECLDGAFLAEVEFDEDISFENVTLREAELSNVSLSGANLRQIDLSGATLSGAKFSEAALLKVELSAADLQGAKISDSSFIRTSLADAQLQGAELLNVDFRGCDLSNSDFEGANLSDVGLRGCELTGATLRETTLKLNSLDGSTTCRIMDEGYDTTRAVQNPVIRRIIKTRPRWIFWSDNSRLNSHEWDATARAYHSLKTAFNNHGLVSKARQQHLHERGARRCEAKAMGDPTRWFKSALAWQATGYGVSIRRVIRNMVILFSLATAIYVIVGFTGSGYALTENYTTVSEILYYSMITFTTTPPEMPSRDSIKFVVMAEGFLGTLLIVFLGYVLGTREQF